MVKIDFTFINTVGMSIYAEDVRIDGITIIDSAYLATSQVQLLNDVNVTDISVPCEVSAMIPDWLLRSKIEQSKAEQQIASDAVKRELIELATN